MILQPTNLRLVATIWHLQLLLVISTTTVCIWSACNYSMTNLRLMDISSFHLDSFHYNFHPRKSLYLQLVANVTKWVIAMWISQMYYTYFRHKGSTIVYWMWPSCLGRQKQRAQSPFFFLFKLFPPLCSCFTVFSPRGSMFWGCIHRFVTEL